MVVTGGTGILATALRRYFPDAVYLSRSDCDVAGACSALRGADVIVHLAAETRHDAPATDLIRTNIIGTQNVAAIARSLGAYLVYASTDYVYEGIDGEYSELSFCKPVNAYAWSKFVGESFVRECDHLIVRGSWYDRSWCPVVVAEDAYTSKVGVDEAAYMIAQLINAKARGTVNIGGPRRSLADIAPPESVRATRSAVAGLCKLDYQLPRDTSLDLTRYRRLTGHRTAA